MIGYLQFAAGVFFIANATWMMLKKSCAPLKRKHRTDLSPEGEKRLSIISSILLLIVGLTFLVLAYCSFAIPDLEDAVSSLLSTFGIVIPALLQLLAIKHYNGKLY